MAGAFFALEVKLGHSCLAESIELLGYPVRIHFERWVTRRDVSLDIHLGERLRLRQGRLLNDARN